MHSLSCTVTNYHSGIAIGRKQITLGYFSTLSDQFSRCSATKTASFEIHKMSHLVEKPTMWFPNGSDTNQAVQSQKQARSLKFWI